MKNCIPIEMNPIWTFVCDPTQKDHVSYSVSEDNTTCELGASNVSSLIGTQVKLIVSDKDGTRHNEKLIDIVSAFA